MREDAMRQEFKWMGFLLRGKDHKRGVGEEGEQPPGTGAVREGKERQRV